MNVVLKNRGNRGNAMRWLLVDACAPVIGVASTRFFTLPGSAFGTALALFAGFFLYIGASDLIPESYHAHPKFLTTATTLAGRGHFISGHHADRLRAAPRPPAHWSLHCPPLQP